MSRVKRRKYVQEALRRRQRKHGPYYHDMIELNKAANRFARAVAENFIEVNRLLVRWAQESGLF